MSSCDAVVALMCGFPAACFLGAMLHSKQDPISLSSVAGKVKGSHRGMV